METIPGVSKSLTNGLPPSGVAVLADKTTGTLNFGVARKSGDRPDRNDILFVNSHDERIQQLKGKNTVVGCGTWNFEANSLGLRLTEGRMNKKAFDRRMSGNKILNKKKNY